MTQQQYNSVTAEELEKTRHELGLDRPIPVQYIDWLSRIVKGDLGKSLLQKTQVSDLIGVALPISLYLGLLSFLVSNIIAIPVGVLCAVRRGKWIDTLLTVLANIGITLPTFWVGILLIYMFALWLHWLPTHGYTPPWEDFWMSIKQAIMPVFCLSLFPLSATVRQTRSAMLEVISQDYMRTAWSKGLNEKSVVIRHALKNGLIPVLTLAGLNVSLIFGGQVLIEIVFSVPGMGYTAVRALLARDYAIVQGVVLVIATAVVLTNLLVDISYGWLDPRVKYN
jgi:peptide/nickel transport system permease protein